MLNALDLCCEGQLRGSDVDPALHFVMKLGALGSGAVCRFRLVAGMRGTYNTARGVI